MDAETNLTEIAAEIRQCTRCPLSRTRKNAVPGAGPANAEIMCIGEGPGHHENEQGLPVVGASGKFLSQLLQDGDVPRETVFITNVVKCRPPGNRDPQPEELLACNNYLERQIEVIDPLIIITLGRVSMARYFDNARISSIHGEPVWHSGRLIVPMYHPAAALHQPNLRQVIAHDFARLKEMIEHEKNRRKMDSKKEMNQDNTSQLSLF